MTLDVYSHAQDHTKEANLIEGYAWTQAANSQPRETFGTRGFTDADTDSSHPVAVVNQSFVKKFFPNEDPIGRHFGIADPKYAGAFEIVGIVADAKYRYRGRSSARSRPSVSVPVR